MIKYLYMFFAIVAFISCEKEEGIGGTASIKGTVFQQDLNFQLSKSGAARLLADKDVFISYGNNTTVDDKIETSPSGEFIFSYLTPGTYTIFTYSDDTLNFRSKNDIVLSFTITISDKDEKADVGDILVYNHIDVDDGKATVTGIVKEIEYYNGTSIPKDTLPAQKKDVYLIYGNSGFVCLDTETQYDGTYIFSNLIPGQYKLYVLSEQPFSNEDLAQFIEFEISESTLELNLDTLITNNY